MFHGNFLNKQNQTVLPVQHSSSAPAVFNSHLQNMSSTKVNTMNPLDRLIQSHFGGVQTIKEPAPPVAVLKQILGINHQAQETSAPARQSAVSLKEADNKLKMSLLGKQVKQFGEFGGQDSSSVAVSSYDYVSSMKQGAVTKSEIQENSYISNGANGPAVVDTSKSKKKTSGKTKQEKEKKPVVPGVVVSIPVPVNPVLPAFFAGSAFLNSPDPVAVPLPDFDEAFWSDGNSSPEKSTVAIDEKAVPLKDSNCSANSLLNMLKGKRK
jgi:Proline-rich nuclear receptor coactivator motif